jgi:hypothetical protein
MHITHNIKMFQFHIYHMQIITHSKVICLWCIAIYGTNILCINLNGTYIKYMDVAHKDGTSLWNIIGTYT